MDNYSKQPIGQSLDTVTNKPVPDKSSSGAAHVTDLTSASWAWPQTWPLDWTGLAGGTSGGETIYQSNDVFEYGYHRIENQSAVAVDVYISTDGTNFSATAEAVFLSDDITVGGTKSVTIPAGKTGYIEGKFRKLKVLQIGTTAVVLGTVRGFHGVK